MLKFLEEIIAKENFDLILLGGGGGEDKHEKDANKPHFASRLI
jgi:hypothetical protein